jgi:hypothetical protein
LLDNSWNGTYLFFFLTVPSSSFIQTNRTTPRKGYKASEENITNKAPYTTLMPEGEEQGRTAIVVIRDKESLPTKPENLA